MFHVFIRVNYSVGNPHSYRGLTVFWQDTSTKELSKQLLNSHKNPQTDLDSVFDMIHQYDVSGIHLENSVYTFIMDGGLLTLERMEEFQA